MEGNEQRRRKKKSSSNNRGSSSGNEDASKRARSAGSARKRDGARGASEGPLVLVDAAHGNDVTLSKGGRHLAKTLGNQHRLEPVKDTLSKGLLLDAQRPVHAIVIAGATLPFAQTELDALLQFVEQGGGLLVLLGEGKERDLLASVLSHAGISSSRDCVLRVSPSDGCMHPKEAVLENCCLNRALASVQTLVYPRGCSLNTKRPAVPLMSSGHLAYPAHRPVAAVSRKQNTRNGIAVLGSSEAAHDKWVTRGDNRALLQFTMQWVCPPSKDTPVHELHQIDADDPDVSDPGPVPEIVSLAERPRCGLQEAQRLPVDFTTLFDTSLAELNLSVVPEAPALHEELGTEKKGLNLIAPQLETPLPQLEPATFPPRPQELEAPPLELLDLDASFQDEKTRIADVLSRCTSGTESEVAYMVKECSKALGIGRPSTDSPKHLLSLAFQTVALNKCSSSNNTGTGAYA